jgi:hypothetical protein
VEGPYIPESMRPLRRLAAALSSILVLQLSLPGGGAPCAPHGSEAPRRTSAHATHAAASGANSSHVAAVDDASRIAPRDCDAPGRHERTSPSAQCLSMTACAVAAPAAPVVGTVAGRVASLHSPEPEPFRAGPAAAPELPPPRA